MAKNTSLIATQCQTNHTFKGGKWPTPNHKAVASQIPFNSCNNTPTFRCFLEHFSSTQIPIFSHPISTELPWNSYCHPHHHLGQGGWVYSQEAPRLERPVSAHRVPLNPNLMVLMLRKSVYHWLMNIPIPVPLFTKQIMTRYVPELSVSPEGNMPTSPVQPNLALILWGGEQQWTQVFQGPKALCGIAALNGGPGSCPNWSPWFYRQQHRVGSI